MRAIFAFFCYEISYIHNNTHTYRHILTKSVSACVCVLYAMADESRAKYSCRFNKD